MFKKVISTTILSILITFSVFAQLNLDSTVLAYGDYKVDNDFLNSYSFSSTYSEYLKQVKGVDVAIHPGGSYWGVGSESSWEFIYYFDSNKKNRRFGYNYDTGKTYFKDLGKVVTTTDGKIFGVDVYTQQIFYWDRTNESFEPEGSIDREFSNVKDICKDNNDNLYILDANLKAVYRYNLAEGEWYRFSSGNDFVDLSGYYNSEWGRASGIIVNSNGIYISYNGGVLVHYSLEGIVQGYYWIDTNNLGLSSSYRQSRSQTWLVSITADPDGNIYVADSKACKIHIFSSNLEYICSWDDPERPIESDISEITFYPNGYNVLTAYPWGFYAYKKQNTLAAVNLADDFVYPECVNNDYRGAEVSLDAVGYGGNLDINAVASGSSYSIVDNRRLSKNEHYELDITGVDKNGSQLPFNSYVLEFLLDDRLIVQRNLEVKELPEITLEAPAEIILNSFNDSLDYNYTLSGDARIRISVGEYSSVGTSTDIGELLTNADFTNGTYSQNLLNSDIPNTYADGYYNVNFDVAPIEIADIDSVFQRSSAVVFLDRETLSLSNVTNSLEGFNPLNSEIAVIEAEYSINEGAFITADVIDEQQNIICSIYNQSYVSAGSHNLTWNGKNNSNVRADDGMFYFSIRASQPETGIDLASYGENFVMDTTPPSFLEQGGEPILYVSPNEASSIGIQDSAIIAIECDEDVQISSTVYNFSAEIINTLITDYNLAGSSVLPIEWNGTNELSEFIADGYYNLVTDAKDSFGNNKQTVKRVVIDNNLLEETVEEQIFAHEEFQVNTYTDNSQSYASIAAIETGYVITWESYGQDGSGYGIFAQGYDSKCNPVGTEFRVNTYTESTQAYPTVASLAEGFIITWHSLNQDGSSYGIYAQRFDSNYNPIGSEIRVNTYTEGSQSYPVVASTGAEFIIAWQSYGQDGAGNGIYAQRYDLDCNPLGGEFRVNSYTENAQTYPAIAASSNSFIIGWESYGQDGSADGVFAQLYDTQGLPVGTEFQVNTYSNSAQEDPSIAMNESGFIISWESLGQDGSRDGIYSQMFDSAGARIGEEFLVNTYTEGDQFSQSIAMEDYFIITWFSYYQDGSQAGIYAQRFDVNGDLFGTEFLVNTYTTNQQIYPVVAVTSKDFIIAWQSNQQDGSNYGIFAKRYEIISIPSGGNLTSLFLSPFEDNYIGVEDFSIEALASDAFIDKYSLSISDGSETQVLLTEEGKTTDGELYYFNILDAVHGEENTVKLEAWDKAGNYRSDEFVLMRDYESLITDFNIVDSYVSDTKGLSANFALETECQVSFQIKDSGGNILSSTDAGTLQSLDHIAVDTTGLDDGSYYLCLNAIHPTLSDAEGRIHFTLDNTRPVVTFDELEEYYSDQDDIEIISDVEEENFSSFTLTLLDSGGNTESVLGNGNSILDLENILFSPNDYNEGAYTLNLAVDDLSGNTGSAEWSLRIDRTAPAIISSLPDYSEVQQGYVAFSALLSDVGGLSGYTLRLVPASGDAVVLESGSNGLVDYSWNSELFGSDIIEGSIEYVLEDFAGNLSTYNYPIIVDNNPPRVVLYFNEDPYFSDGHALISGTNTIYIMTDSSDEFSSVESISYRLNNGDWTDYNSVFGVENSGSYLIEYFALDSHGNSSGIQNYNFIVDADPPTAVVGIDQPKYVSGVNTFVPLENNINILPSDGFTQYSSGVKKCEYKINNTAWEVFTDNITIFQNGPVQISTRVIDNVGNVAVTEGLTVIVDQAPPVTTFEADNEYYHSLQRNIVALPGETIITLAAEDIGTVEDSSGVNSTFIRIGDEESEYTGAFTINSEIPQEYTFFSVDNVGNRENANPTIFAVDVLAPVVECTIPADVYIENDVVYTKGGNVFALTATDNFAGVKDIFYDTGSGEFQIYTEPLSWQDDIEFELSYYAQDFIGLESQTEKLDISIDNTPPQTHTLTNLSLIEIDDTLYADDRYQFSWAAIDTASGVAETYINIDGVIITDDIFVFTTEGEHLIKYYSVDNLGNTEPENELRVITPIPDTTPPVTSLSSSDEPYHDVDMDYYTSLITFTLSAEDLMGGMDSYASGVETIFYSLDSGVFQEYLPGTLFSFEEEGFHQVSYYSVDITGNQEVVQNYYLTIDDTPPVTVLGLDFEKYLETDGVLYIPESELIGFTSVDALSGIKEIYYFIDEPTDINIYQEPFSLAAGDYQINWYAEDNLGNTEEVSTQRISVSDEYNLLSYKTIYYDDFFSQISEYDFFENRFASLKGWRKKHIYISELSDDNDFDWPIRLSARSADRTQIALGSDWVATIENNRNWQDLYLYSLDIDNRHINRQYGVPVSQYGINRDPVFIENILYWIKEDDYHNYLYEYNPATEISRIIHETTGMIRGLQKNKGILSYLDVTGSEQKLYVVNEGISENIYSLSTSDKTILNYAVQDDVLAIEWENSENDSIITIYHHLQDENPVVLSELSGRNPSIADNQLYYVLEVEENDIIVKYSLTTGNLSYLIKGSEIFKYILTDNQDVFVSRDTNIAFMSDFNDFFFDFGGRHSGITNSLMNRFKGSEFIYLKNTEEKPIIDDINFSSGNYNFALNSCVDSEDFIYADEQVTFPAYIMLDTELHQLQTINNDTASDPLDPYLTFKTLKDLEVFVLVDERVTPDLDYHFRQHGFRKDNSFFNNILDRRMRFLGSFVRFNLYIYNVDEGETFTLDGITTDDYSPLIFMRERK